MDQENGPTGKAKDKVTVTPLIQYLRDKKATKGKENTITPKGARHSRQDSKEGKPAGVENKTPTGTTVTPAPKKRSAQAVKVEQAARDAVKVLNKQAASINKNAPSPAAPTAPSVTPAVTPNSTASAALADKKRERGSLSAAASIVQRDLGIGGRGGRRGSFARAPVASNGPPVAKQAAGNSPNLQTAGTLANTTTSGSNGENHIQDETKTMAQVVPSSRPAGSGVPPKAPAFANQNTTASNARVLASKPNQPPSNATQAFLKHANPSQGITEPLLEEAFAVFGTVAKVEIDKKKGFAYVDFGEPEGLQKAIKASPIKVAQGQVVVLERKTGSTLQTRNVRGGGTMSVNRGGMPGGGRGSMRGRGGFGRGGVNMPIANSAKRMPAKTPATSSTQESVTATPPIVKLPASENQNPQSATVSDPNPVVSTTATKIVAGRNV